MKAKLNLIQALRGLTAIAVVFRHVSVACLGYYHMPWCLDIFLPSWNGVDIFFVLSGFIITYMHLNDICKRKNLKLFFIKRFNRIYPVYWILFLIYFALFIIAKSNVNLSGHYLLSNILLLETHGRMPIIRASWSLCFEVMFYLVFGLCIRLGWRAAKFIWIGWLLATITCYLLLPTYQIPFLLRPYILEFLMGCLAGYIFKSITTDETSYSWIRNNNKWLLATGLLMFLCMSAVTYFTVYGQNRAIESILFYGLSATLIIGGAAITDYKHQYKVPQKLLLLGDASYVIYLIHLLVLAIVFKVSQRFVFTHNTAFHIFLLGLCAVVLSVASGIIFHLALEKPLLHRLNKRVISHKETLQTASLQR